MRARVTLKLGKSKAVCPRTGQCVCRTVYTVGAMIAHSCALSTLRSMLTHLIMILSPQAYFIEDFIEAFVSFRDGRACLLGTWSIPRETAP